MRSLASRRVDLYSNAQVTWVGERARSTAHSSKTSFKRPAAAVRPQLSRQIGLPSLRHARPHVDVGAVAALQSIVRGGMPPGVGDGAAAAAAATTAATATTTTTALPAAATASTASTAVAATTAVASTAAAAAAAAATAAIAAATATATDGAAAGTDGALPFFIINSVGKQAADDLALVLCRALVDANMIRLVGVIANGMRTPTARVERGGHRE